MSYSFVNSHAVKADITNAVDYYKNINPELARQFLFRIREAKSYIALTPLGFQVKYKDVRTLLLKQFPYHIHYLIDDAKQQIIILAIIHAYKNPQDYSGR
ncbi:MAG: type II toxin-antitoxin system RelE/ParE family toxin [Bacteroidia bacterium]